jgi:transposase
MVGFKKLLSKCFRVTEVDEYQTSKTCNRCTGELSTCKEIGSRNLYSRFYCHGCRSDKKLTKQFVDRNLNVAANMPARRSSSSPVQEKEDPSI